MKLEMFIFFFLAESKVGTVGNLEGEQMILREDKWAQRIETACD